MAVELQEDRLPSGSLERADLILNTDLAFS